MQATSSEPSTDTTIIRTGSDGRLRYTAGQRQNLLEAFERSGLKLRETQIIKLLACGWASPRRQGVAECWLAVS
jgi:hypothetical protein